jgi:hypothetical protein
MKTLSVGFWFISVVLILVFSIPCFAQVETQRYNTTEGTEWKIENIDVASYFGFDHLGFFAGSIWLCWGDGCFEIENAHYRNWLISRFHGDGTFPSSYYEVTGCIIPFLNTGRVTFCGFNKGVGRHCFYSTLTKDNDDFIPLP